MQVEREKSATYSDGALSAAPAKQEALLRDLADLEQTEVSPHRKSFLERIREYFQPSETTDVG